MIDPHRIHTRDVWNAAMWQLYHGSGLSYHVLAERCGSSTSTLQRMATGQSFPRPSTVRSFVQACGESDLQPWVDARNRVRASDMSVNKPPTPPVGMREAEASDDPVIRPAPQHVLDYTHTVSRFAAPVLKGRDAELAELRDFCLRPSGESYSYWRGTAWAGKTALLAAFVLAPPDPEEVTLIAFFVRAGAQDDYQDFLRVVTQQLGVVLGEAPPPHPSRADLDSMLHSAARKCGEEDRRLVLVVDGLDEDYFANRSRPRRRPSIASLLPERPPDGMRVIASGRPDPPVDVPKCHPLRDPGVARELVPSDHAAVIQQRAEQDLTDMLDDTALSRRLLGLIVAAGTGLSIRCLAALTHKSERKIKRRLATVSGRVLHRLGTDGATTPDSDSEYDLAHADLRRLARTLMSEELDDHRRRIFAGAEEYRRLGWPSQTPEYLFRSFFRMLEDVGDLPRMAECATDLARQGRMRDLFGADTAALTEITTAQDVIVAQDNPDLVAMVRLAIHRDRLAAQNHNTPLNLPPVWALLGDIDRAEASARSHLDRHGWERQAEVLPSVTKATARTGHLDRAETIARSICTPWVRAKALVWVAEAAVQAGAPERTTTLIDDAQAIGALIDDLRSKALTLGAVAAVAAKAGQPERAATLIDQAEAVARSITDVNSASSALVLLVEATAEVSGIDRAEALARAITAEYEDRDKALMSVTEAVARTGDVQRTEITANSITAPYWRTRALASAAGIVAEAGDIAGVATLIARAHDIADSIDGLEQQAWGLCSVAEAAGKARDRDLAGRLIDRAEANARAIDTRSSLMADQQARVLVAVAETAARIGDLDRADAIIRSIVVLAQQAWALASVAEVVARAGDVERARALILRAETVSRTPDLMGQRELLSGLRSVTEAAVEAGDLDGARLLVARAEAIARSISGAEDRSGALASAAEVAAVAGDPTRADAVIKFIADPYVQAWALMRTGDATARAGSFDQARELLGRAATMARRAERNDFQRARSLGSSIDSAANAVELGRAEAAAKSGNLRRATRIADSVRCTHEEQAKVLVAMSDFVARDGTSKRAGDLVERAETVADSIRIDHIRVDPFEHERAVRTLALLAKVVAKTGDSRRAGSYIARAEGIADSIIGAHEARALASVAEAAVDTGHHDRGRSLITRAEAAADSIDNPYTRASVLVSVAEAAVRASDLDRANAIAESIDPSTTPEQQALAFLTLTASQEPHRRARATARALRIAHWHLSIRELVKMVPEALAVVIAEVDAATKPDVS
ncbi:hypothetical protein ADK67_36890 [Saccharothrix sp. NRRL B-16348]|uniref:tetratricopeptide repeat protein n=1 Tax=Saccharothrix sp. NRRL B-16348 TaxID=1415542 RepID=UPI0006AE766C|nr:helix-turn-helix domain-containing protein [Saccharothrix sp. NRRL B-16348]KOX18464.1 hypothetical protein ADK67_36890 [Saccharothrix sp. NRRL B-16348]